MSLVLDQDEVTIGRSLSCDVPFDPANHPHISRIHGKLVRGDDGRWMYEDAGSKHGSYINGNLVHEPAQLDRGDKISLGSPNSCVVITWPTPRVTGSEATYLKFHKKESTHFPLAFSEPFLGTYRRYKKIGAGGYGEVWRASPIDEEKDAVAVKLLHPDLLTLGNLEIEERLKLIRRFRREAKLMHLLSEADIPGVVKVYDWGDDPDRDYLFLVMDYIDGGSLERFIFRNQMIEPQPALKYLYQIARTLQYAHEFKWTDDDGTERHGIIHRDIKPANILIDEHKDETWIVDFGIAAIEEGGERLTATNTALGSIRFLPPEALFSSSTSGAVDLWAFAVTAYVLLSRGHFPYSGSKITELYQNMREGKITPLTYYRFDIEKSFCDALHSALDPNPESRIQTAAEWVDLLDSMAGADFETI
ncbi:protein kinase [bacterium]|nr:protein kinase [bacterium]